MNPNKIEYKIIPSELVVLPKGEPTFSEQATFIGIEDEAAGAYVRIKQNPDKGPQEIFVTPEEWPHIKEAIEQMIGVCGDLG